MLEALADGICDCLLAHVYERRITSGGEGAPAVARPQWEKVVRALDHLNAIDAEAAQEKRRPGTSRCAPRSAISILRFPGQWERGRAKLKRWAARFDEKFPD